jgi:hypothetical protein
VRVFPVHVGDVVLVDDVTSRFHGRRGVVEERRFDGLLMLRIPTDSGAEALLPFRRDELITVPAAAVA